VANWFAMTGDWHKASARHFLITAKADVESNLLTGANFKYCAKSEN